MNISTFYGIFGTLLALIIIASIIIFFYNKKKIKTKKDSKFESKAKFYKLHKKNIFDTKTKNFQSGFLIASGKSRWNKLSTLNPDSKYKKISDIEGYLIPKSHMLVLGSSGSGKTDTILMPNIILNSIAKDAPNGLIFDPKGEIYNVVSPFLKSQGYKVILINLTDTVQSHRWNPFQYAIDLAIDHIKYKHLIYILENKELYINERDRLNALQQNKYNEAYTSIEDTARTLIASVDKEQNIWNQNAKDLFAITSRVLLDHFINKSLEAIQDIQVELQQNIYDTINLIFQNTSIENKLRNILKNLNYKNIINMITTTSQCNWEIFLTSKNYSANLGIFRSTKDQYASFIMNVSGGTSALNEPAFQDIISESDFSYQDLINEKIMVFINIPSNIETRKSLAVILTNQIFNFLEQSAKDNKNNKLDKPFYFYMEELGNLPQINCVSSIITLGRGMNMFGYIFVQSIQQIEEKYGKEAVPKFWDSTMFKIFLLVQYPDIAKTISDMYGEERAKTIDGQLISKKLLEVSELLKIGNGECLVMEQRKQPLYLKLASIKNYQILANFEKEKYNGWFLQNEFFYSNERQKDIQIITKKDETILLNNIIDEYIKSDFVEKIIWENYKEKLENKKVFDHSDRENFLEYLTDDMIRILIKNDLSKFHIDESFANLIRPKIKQILTNQYDFFNKKEKNKVIKSIKKSKNINHKTNAINLVLDPIIIEKLEELKILKNKEIEASFNKNNFLRNNLLEDQRILEKEIIKKYKKKYGEIKSIKEIKKLINI